MKKTIAIIVLSVLLLASLFTNTALFYMVKMTLEKDDTDLFNYVCPAWVKKMGKGTNGVVLEGSPCQEEFCDELIMRHICTKKDDIDCIDTSVVFKGRDTILVPLLNSVKTSEYKELMGEFIEHIRSCIESANSGIVKNYCDVTPDSLKFYGGDIYEYYPDVRKKSNSAEMLMKAKLDTNMGKQ